MPSVQQIAAILPKDATLTLFAGWEVLAYQAGGVDALIYGHWLVTSLRSGCKAGAYEADIRRA